VRKTSIGSIETSAKTGKNIEELLFLLIKSNVNRIEEYGLEMKKLIGGW